ncbi:MAG: serine hydrolase domain-containing protein [Candidatus Limiplasma sp.]|nr:serine hydrolase domain-containing protein [Candidatus Limiplasma sp.]
MPVGTLKNRLYGLGLAAVGRRSLCALPQVHGEGAKASPPVPQALYRILRRRHVVGAAIQRLSQGKLAECYTAGLAGLAPAPVPVTPDTFFRTASVAKLATALLVFRMQTLGKLAVEETLEDFLGLPVRNPRFPETPITLGMLLSHTSSLVDSPAYFASFQGKPSLAALLKDPAAFASHAPGSRFQYSNLAAGMIASLLEARFGQSFEALAQEFLFKPLELRATFDPSALAGAAVADSYRVLPFSSKPAFQGAKRVQTALPLGEPHPDSHYLLASGNLYISAPHMGRLLLPLMRPASPREASFLSPESLLQLREPKGQWPDHRVPLGHSMGLLTLEDDTVSAQRIYGHQGFAYGAVNGVFFTGEGDGFVCLNSGASEQREGHLALLNRDLIRLFLP